MEPALKEWFDKTDWVRSTIKPNELGMHIADVLKQRIENLEQQIAKQEAALWLTQRITDYLAGGGLYNPELADHGAVRDLLIDCREALAEQPAQHQCSRSHPHENMDAMCELRTEIARLTNENARLKAQQQEPVAWIEHGSNEVPSIVVWERGGSGHYTPLYTSPPTSKPWVGLTDEELADIAMQSGAYDGQLRDFARAIEAKLREKNT